MARAFFFAAATFALFACAPVDALDTEGPVRLLDRACGGTTTECSATGAAKRTTGLTADSVGYTSDASAEGVITLVIPPQNLPYGDDTFHFELLAMGSGEVKLGDANRTLPSDYGWVTVDSSYATSDPTRPELTPKTTIVLRVPKGVTANVLDVRLVSHRSLGC